MAFQTALSGLNAAKKDLDVVGNNIANASTTGFKKSRAEFSDIYASTITGASSTQTGSGVAVANIAQQFSQGNVEFTDNNLDLAVNGEGFFVLNDSDGGEMFTRSGMFSVDREGYVVNSHGHKLQSYTVNDEGTVDNLTPEDLRLATGSIPAQSSSATAVAEGAATPDSDIDINLNLDADATPISDTGLGQAQLWDSDDSDYTGSAAISNPPQPSEYNFTTSTTVYDSLGGAHTGTLYFQKAEKDDAGNAVENAWNVYMALEDANGELQLAPEVQSLQFGPNGALKDDENNFYGGSIADNVSQKLEFFGGATEADSIADGGDGFDPGNGADAMGFDIDLADVDDEGGGSSTQYSGESSVNSIVQHGYTTGRLSGIDIDPTGIVFARYTNGQSNALGAVAMASFNNNGGLQPVGDTNWVQTYSSGEVIYGQANRGQFGAIQSGALESSNVDHSKELVDMITAQRNYQANAKMISTEDQVTQTIINIR